MTAGTSPRTPGLPVYSGPEGACPRCGVPDAMTEWHQAAAPASRDMAGRRPPCAEHSEPAVLGGEAGHLCRFCMNCGYGWPEACTGQETTPLRVSASAACAGLFSLAADLASAGADVLLNLLLSGTALAAAWVAATAAISVTAAACCATVAGPPAGHGTRRRP